LMQIVIEDAGAERGCFVSVRKDDLYMEAQADIGQHEVAVFKSMRIEEKEDLALSVANYVRQTKDVVVLDNATERGDFTTDPYVLEKQPKSILCLPVIRQSKLVGILYLENNVATGAFTPDRIEILKLLASQAAISVENARLYENVLHNERALRESEEKYRTILESIEDGYYEVDTSGNFRLVNDSLCRIFGYQRDALIGMNYSQLMDEQNAENIKKTFKEVFTTGAPVKGFDNDFTRKDGIQINNELSVSLIKDSKGKKIGFRGIVRDITSRKRTAEELRMHRDHLEELVKERTVELLKANEKLKEEIKARMAAEKELMQYRDQLELLVKKRTVQLTAANEQLRQEIKDRKRAEGEAKLRQEQLFQAAKMASLGTLVSGVAHEINNPISFITLNAPILQKAWQGVTPILDNHCQANGDVRIANLCYTELRKRIPLLLLGITEGGRRVKAIVRDLKEFARQSPPELTDMVDLNRTAKTAVGLVSNMIKKSTNHFSEVYEAHLPVIKGNAQRIEQVIINLLVNACQSLSDKERGISLSTAYKKTSECLIIKIRDQGAGMSSDVLDRIRDPFFTTKRDSGGTGLGLAISDRIVADHGGSMVFDSAPDEGTVVRVCFPIVQPPKKEARF
jgi:PAS domain S-box-containing protein